MGDDRAASSALRPADHGRGRGRATTTSRTHSSGVSRRQDLPLGLAGSGAGAEGGSPKRGTLRSGLRRPSSASRAMRGRAIRSGAGAGAAAAVAVNGRSSGRRDSACADIAPCMPITPATRFGHRQHLEGAHLAAALSLVERGMLDLDAPVERYLPDFPHRGRGITLRRIGAHQSGISDTFADEHYYTTTHYHARQRLPGHRAAAADVRVRQPERIRDRPVHHRGAGAGAGGRGVVPGPDAASRVAACRDASDRAERSAPSPRTAAPRSTSAGPAAGSIPARPTDPSLKLPGAGFLSTAEDVARFGAALLGAASCRTGAGRDLHPGIARRRHADASTRSASSPCAKTAAAVLLQPGGGPGIAGWLAIYPDDGVVVAILSNATGAPLGGDGAARGRGRLPHTSLTRAIAPAGAGCSRRALTGASTACGPAARWSASK